MTTVRYQAVWESGYTCRWTTDLAKQIPYHEITLNPDDAIGRNRQPASLI